MNKTPPAWRTLAIALAVLVLLAGSLAAQAVKSDQQTLEELERRWHMAFLTGDIKFLETILDDDFIATYDDGVRANKAKELELAAAFNQQIDASALDEFTVRVYGNTAVVLFTLRLRGPMQGKPVELAFRYTDVWVMRDGRWRCVTSHSTRLNPKPEK